MILVVVLAVVVGLWLMRRRSKRALVAGLTAERPAFHVEPPAGRLGKSKDGHL